MLLNNLPPKSRTTASVNQKIVCYDPQLWIWNDPQFLVEERQHLKFLKQLSVFCRQAGKLVCFCSAKIVIALGLDQQIAITLCYFTSSSHLVLFYLSNKYLKSSQSYCMSSVETHHSPARHSSRLQMNHHIKYSSAPYQSKQFTYNFIFSSWSNQNLIFHRLQKIVTAVFWANPSHETGIIWASEEH